MGGNNNFIKMINSAKRVGFEAGLQSGRQQILDMMSLVLHNPKYVDKDVFGKVRLLRVVNGIGEYLDKYEPAWKKTDEADYYQTKMDEELAEAYGDGLKDSFHDRYEFAPEYDYTKGKWKK